MLNGKLMGVRGLSGEIQREVIYGGGSGVSDYPELNDLPQINGVELVGNKTSEELGLAGVEYVDKKVADLVNSAPETLDTLGEVAQAIQENESVVDALNGAIGNKAEKSEVTELGSRVTDLENAGSENNFIHLTGTAENPINLYTDLEVGKGYILSGHIKRSSIKTLDLFYSVFAYKQSKTNTLIYNFQINKYGSGATGSSYVTSVTYDSSGNFSSTPYSLVPLPDSGTGHILTSNYGNTPKWANLSELTDFVNLANKVTTLETDLTGLNTALETILGV